MISHKLCCCVSILVAPFLAQLASGDVLWQECDNSRNYTANSGFQSNLKQLSTTLPTESSSSPTLFATAAVGAIPDTAYALSLCRGDTTNASACGDCVANAFRDAQQVCSYNMDVTIYYDPCYLRFSNQNFLTSIDNTKRHIMPNGENVTSPAATFDAAVGVLLAAVADYAALNSSRRFGTGVEDLDVSTPRIYAMAQCTPDMAPADCRSCLEGIVSVMPKHFSRRQGGRILGLRCNYRFELYPPFSDSPLLHLPAPASGVTPSVDGDGGGRRNKPSTILLALAVALAVVSAALTFTIVCFCVRRRRRQQELPSHSTDSGNWESVPNINLPMLDLSALEVATENFSEGNKLGEGGFGAVYKGSLADGQEIAVKRLSQGSAQGIAELKTELVLVAKLQHKNLVRLIGVCLEEHEKLVIYEYMPNRSLDTILFDPERSKHLDWGKRFKIINGIARGLQYVHEDSQLKIIHRDLKASNVLLDSDLNPKISDFGLARLFEGDQSKDVTNRVVGTFGYMAPEYVVRGHYSTKSDVFSFGILVLEIITGRRNCGSYNSEQSVDLLSLIWEHWTSGTILEIADPSLASRSSVPEEEILTYVHIGLMCVQESPADRPTMSRANAILNSDTVSLQAPSKPAFCIRACTAGPEPRHGASQGRGRPAVVSPNEVSLTELVPR
ncbi:cysteine-rich receptor-like protein kinase 6 [Triticum dicoccoides]|uniref:cysteine-rich receptor-like protein kinase 6 n=1 Tax=Triticum dicoccoides TaxID=85692 RepID=UPI00188E0A35|nr:cysteine-rich receptor-like protein kinase 6 [Triticum dicoccoides]